MFRPKISLSCGNFENWICRCNSLEIRQRCVFVHRDVRSRAGGSLEIGFYDRSAECGGDFFQANFLPAARTLRTHWTFSPNIDTK